MPKVKVSTIVSFCDNLLRTGEIQDYDGAVNGLQVANRNGTISKIVATVDASLATARLAVNAGADLMLVHHGLFWSQSYPWVGKRFELQRLLIENNLAVYSSHLPLDVHPKLGTGGAGSDLKKAFDEGVDTFITGEGPHWTFGLAQELGINVLYGGHYATETFGVKALAAYLSKTFKLPWVFVDYPTGL